MAFQQQQWRSTPRFVAYTRGFALTTSKEEAATRKGPVDPLTAFLRETTQSEADPNRVLTPERAARRREVEQLLQDGAVPIAEKRTLWKTYLAENHLRDNHPGFFDKSKSWAHGKLLAEQPQRLARYRVGTAVAWASAVAVGLWSVPDTDENGRDHALSAAKRHVRGALAALWGGEPEPAPAEGAPPPAPTFDQIRQNRP